MKTFYLIIQNRYGVEDAHTYCTGMSEDIRVANIMGKWFRDSRGGKYEFRLKTIQVPAAEKYYVLQMHDGDYENSIFQICLNSYEAVTVLNEYRSLNNFKFRERFDLDNISVWTLDSICGDTLKEVLQQPWGLDDESMQLVKDLYEKNLRTKDEE